MALTYQTLHANTPSLTKRVNAALGASQVHVMSITVEPISALDIFYSDGAAQNYVGKLTVVSVLGPNRIEKTIFITPDARHCTLYGYEDPSWGPALNKVLSQLVPANFKIKN